MVSADRPPCERGARRPRRALARDQRGRYPARRTPPGRPPSCAPPAGRASPPRPGRRPATWDGSGRPRPRPAPAPAAIPNAPTIHQRRRVQVPTARAPRRIHAPLDDHHAAARPQAARPHAARPQPPLNAHNRCRRPAGCAPKGPRVHRRPRRRDGSATSGRPPPPPRRGGGRRGASHENELLAHRVGQRGGPHRS